MMMLSFNDFFPKNVGTFISDRTVDFSLDKERPQWNSEQARLIAEQVGLENTQPFNVRQVHANTVLIVDEETPPLQEADGLLTRLKEVPLVIRTADCLPVFFFDERQECIGLVHAGWRGTREQIAVKAVEKMQEAYGTKVKDLKIAFGPAIRACCYQVGEEFAQYFPGEISPREDGFYLDLAAANQRQLTALHIDAEQIYDCGICTCCNKEFFSFRREGERAGRMISLMVLKG